VEDALANARIYTDFGGLAELKAGARRQSPEARREVARQFEAMFLQMVLKSMRQAGKVLGEGEGQQVEFYQQLFDQQIALELAGRDGLGLARTLEGALDQAPPAGDPSRNLPGRRAFAPRAPTASLAPPGVELGPVTEPPAEGDWPPADPEAFVQRLWPAARRAASRLGVDPKVILAQAALESGWGRYSPGGDSHNLFGIKADGAWKGERVEVSTLEFRQGVAVREKAAFRAYDSPEASLEDYADFIQGNPRYRPALARAADPDAYLEALQRAGYATDPAYADKIRAILHSGRFTQALKGVEASVDPLPDGRQRGDVVLK